jgi:uncharacterized protein YfaS (alpha-2-macroglobulin family)
MRRFLAVLLLAGIALASCRDSAAKQMSANISKYVYAYTSGTMSRNSPVRVRLTTSLVGADQINSELKPGIMVFRPAISGKAIWEDDRTIRFEPASPLAAGTHFVGTVFLNRLFPSVESDAEKFEFDFVTREMYISPQIEGLQAVSTSDWSKQELIGHLSVSDDVVVTELEKGLTVSQNGRNLPISWNHTGGLDGHEFVVGGIDRTDKPGEVVLAYTGAPIGAPQSKGEIKVEVPALGDFKAVSARFVQNDQDQYAVVRFSDPLREGQDLNGLIGVSDYYGSLSYAIDGHSVRVYPSYSIEGERRVNINEGIKNSQGAVAPVSSFELNIVGLKPAVRLAGRGAILPDADQLFFPFDAVNLNYVEVEIFKIFNNNVLQFLQTNTLDGQQELERVGRVIHRQRVSLRALNPAATTQEWSRYALDLSKIVKTDPGAIYQIRIGFRPEYSNFACAGKSLAQSELTPLPEQPLEGEDIESFWGYYGFGNNDWNDDYDWRRREDPCYKEYYNGDRFIRRNIVASTMGLMAKRGNDGSLQVTAAHLKTTESMSGVKVDIFDYQQQLIGSATTDSEGHARIVSKRKPAFVLASKGTERGYLATSDGQSLSLSGFEVDGVAPQKGIKGYLYGERGVWRPGDSLFLNFVLEDKINERPDYPPVTLELYDPRGTLQFKQTSANHVGGIYPFKLATSPEAATGSWLAKITAGGAQFQQRVRIETVKPNKLKLKFDPGKKMLQSSDADFQATLAAHWLHGSPLSNGKARVEAQLMAADTRFDKFPDFEFDDPGRSIQSESQVIYDGPLNAQGLAGIKHTFNVGDRAPGKLKINFRLRAFEPSGDASADFTTVDFSPFPAYVGVRLPKQRNGEKRVDIGKEASIEVAAVSEDGRPLANREVVAQVYRVEWRWWWEDAEMGSAYAQSKNLVPLSQHKLTTGANGRVSFKTTVQEWGRYYVRVNDPVSKHATGDFVYAGYPWNDDNDAAASRDGAARLAFSTGKETYQVGETIEINIPAAQAGRAMVSIENGQKVVGTYWLNAQSGENKFKLKATADMAPTVYANITFVQPHGQVTNDRPIRLYGILPIRVEDPKSKLAPKISVPDVVKPDQPFTIEVAETTGRPMAYTLAVVDEGLLDLTRFETPNPWQAFNAKEALGVTTWDVYDNVVGAYGGKLERILNVGGDGAAKPKNAVRANRFKPVVRHLGPFNLAANGKAKHNITIDNYIGSVRVMVVAAGSNAYGSAEKAVAVRKPLMIQGTLPRVLSPGEKLRLPVTVFALEDKVKNVQLSVADNNKLIQFTGANTKSLSFSRLGEQMAYFDITAPDKPGIAKIVLKATGGGEQASELIEIEVRNPNPIMSQTSGGIAEAGSSWKGAYKPVGTPGTNQAEIEISTFPPINLSSRLRYLIEYPHGCLEQTTSGAFPQLYVDRFAPLDEVNKKRVQSQINEAINKIKSHQTAGGGLSYWPGHTGASPYAGTYALHFLLEAKARGYALPAGMLDRLLTYQKKTAQRWDPQTALSEMGSVADAELDQAYRLFTLAKANQADLGAMNRLRERKDLSLAARWRLAAAYAINNRPDVAKQLINNQKAAVDNYRQMSYTYGSDMRDRAMIAETQILMGDKNGAFENIKILADRLSSNEWLSTQEVAYSLLAAAQLAGNTAATKTACTLVVNGKSQTLSIDKMTRVAIQADKAAEISVANTGKSWLFIRVVASGRPAMGKEPGFAGQLQLQVKYTDSKGNVLDPTRILQGTDFIAEVKVTNTGSLGVTAKEIALTQVFPAGWEVLNPNEHGTGALASATPTYRDVRDDRVLSYFDLGAGSAQTFRLRLNAAYQGRYYMPAIHCGAMYNPQVQASVPGRWVEVVARGGEVAVN